MKFHKSKAPSTPGVYMERVTSRLKITMIKQKWNNYKLNS